MKKLFSILLFTALMGMVFTACGDDKNEPDVPTAKNLVSVHENDETDQYFVFDIDINKDWSTIYMYNIQFAPGAHQMTLRVNVPVSLSSNKDAYVMTGTDLVAEREQEIGWLPMSDERFLLKNLSCTVNPDKKEYSISFDAHSGHFEESGKLM